MRRLKPKVKKYHIKKKIVKVPNIENNKISKAYLRLVKRGTWEVFSPKMRKSFLNPKNWTIIKSKNGYQYTQFKYWKQFKGTIKGMGVRQMMKTTQGVTYFIKQKNRYINSLKNVERLSKTQIDKIMSLNKKILWSQFYSARTKQRRDFIKSRIERQKKETYNLLSSSSSLTRANMWDFIFNFHKDLLDQYRATDNSNMSLTDYEIYEKYKEAIFIDLGLDNLRKGKHDWQDHVYWDDTNNTIIYVDF